MSAEVLYHGRIRAHETAYFTQMKKPQSCFQMHWHVILVAGLLFLGNLHATPIPGEAKFLHIT